MLKTKKALAGVVAAALCVTSVMASAVTAPEAEAAKKPSLKKNVTVKAGKSVTVKVKNAKKAKITWKSNKKKIATVKKSGKFGAKIKGIKKGQAVITAKVKIGKKKNTLKCKVKVKAAGNSKNTNTNATPLPAAPSATAAVPSAGPQTTEVPAPAPVPTPTLAPTPTPIPTFAPVVYKNAAFDTTADGFAGTDDNVSVSVTDAGYEGKCITATGRTDAAQGLKLDVKEDIVPGATYRVSAYMKHAAAANTALKCVAKNGTQEQEVASVADAAPGEWTKVEGTVSVPVGLESSYAFVFVSADAAADISLDSVEITQVTAPVSILEAYKYIFPHLGTCANYIGYGEKANQLQTPETVSFIKRHFNSFTHENEMKPDALLGGRATLISKEEALGLGYVIPESYKDELVPKLNFDVVDQSLEFCKKEGIQMRAHTLMWHQQTPAWYFTEEYEGSDDVTPEVMDARLEFYIRTVMKHVMDKEKELTGSNGDLVYAWDVTNEYLHRSNGPSSHSWMDVYGDLGLQPTYVKKAFQLAYDMLKQYGAEDKVTLFYNDYDTYFCSDDLVQLVTYINSGEEAKICGGIGMQSHVDIDRPTLQEYGAALDKFLATGLEVQITELDITINFDHVDTFSYEDEEQTDEDQAAFTKDFMELVVNKQKNRDKTVSPKGITGVTVWGLYDSCSWRNRCEPLFFGSSINDPKPSFYSFIEAAKVWEQ